MKADGKILDIRIGDGDTVFFRNIKAFIAKAVDIVVMRVCIFDQFCFSSLDPFFLLHEERFFFNQTDCAPGRHGLCLRPLGTGVFPIITVPFSDIRFDWLAFFCDNIPISIIFPAKNVIDVFLIGLIKLKPTVLFHKSDKPIRRHHGSSFAVFLTQLLLRGDWLS